MCGLLRKLTFNASSSGNGGWHIYRTKQRETEVKQASVCLKKFIMELSMAVIELLIMVSF